MSLIIYGSSDDLIEVDGEICEEFNLFAGESHIAVSNGALIRVVYTAAGVWRISLVSKPGDVDVVIVSAPEDDDDNYSDRCTIDGGNIAWVVLGSAFAVQR